MRTKPNGSYISYFSNLVKIKGGINLAQGIPGYQPTVELINLLGAMVQCLPCEILPFYKVKSNEC